MEREAYMERALEPVSYTHLDVYKRQACSHAVTQNVPLYLQYIVEAAVIASIQRR